MIKQIIEPLSLNRFFDEIWDKSYLKFPKRDTYIIDFSTENLIDILNFNNPDVAFFDELNLIPKSEYYDNKNQLSIKQVNKLLKNKHTVQIRNIHKYNKTLMDVHKLILEDFSCEIIMTGYYCLGPSQGIRPHYDPHHIFAFQLEGTKEFHFSSQREDTPNLENTNSQIFKTKSPPPMDEKITIQPKDILYIPPGAWHKIFNTTNSAHITIGIRPYRWNHLIQQLLDKSIQESADIRKQVPYKVSNNSVLRQIITISDIENYLNMLKNSFINSSKEEFNNINEAPLLNINGDIYFD